MENIQHKKQKVDKSSSNYSYVLPYYDENEINKKLAENNKYLNEWDELLTRTCEFIIY